ncbi:MULTISPECIES: hypothetical protein [unclassified Nocardioides]|uniref:hypothetical protein n=1 Tax=unclassified Nocardioides TaxID=2615069 RepID=UPI0006FA3C53|nr:MULTISPECIES: hypothetical protein [unclassified Nocardioides]KRA29645.1 hypothetical protein ASD81_22060 [Nocardioides sp. Root614]KRA88180.1 hypothetical protein ASD84_19555 [Nocardioides sp. Root682]
MSQTATPQAAPPPAAAATAPAPAPAVAAKPTPGLVDTPALLNRWQLIGMTTAILFGVFSALIQFGGWQADGRAADDTEQLVRVQEIQSSLLRADALATNAFLVGGLEEPEQRKEYDDALESVLRQIANAAEAQPADREVLATLNVDVTAYATAVAQARDNNRQGFPIGAEYLSGASTELRADALPILDALVKANTDRAENAMAGQHPFWLLVLGIVALVALVWLNRELAQHFKRRINKGLAIAAAIVLVVTVVTAFAALLRDNSNDSLREGELATAVSEANARTAANDAKANESLRLINRGSGEGFEDLWSVSAKEVEKFASRDTRSGWDAYVAQHNEIVELDRAGKWDEAVEIATKEAGGSTESLDAFDQLSQQIVTANGTQATDDLRSGRVVALVLSGLTLLLGVAAAVAVSRGIGERRREFA